MQRNAKFSVLTSLLTAIMLTSCSEPLAPEDTTEHSKPAIILSMNDIYRINGIKRGSEGGLARVALLREQLEKEGDVLVIHAGDVLSPSLLGGRYQGEQMVDMLNFLDGTDDAAHPDTRLFTVFGNHEFDNSRCSRPDALVARVKQSQFTWLSGNMDFSRCPDSTPGFKDIADAENVIPHASVTVGGIKFGLFGITINNDDYWQLLTDRDQDYSENLSAVSRRRMNVTSYVAAAKRLTEKLRADGNEFIIAVTHLDWSEDSAILGVLEGALGPDMIIGGHNHSEGILPKSGPGPFVYKHDAEARTVGVFRFSKATQGPISYAHKSIILKAVVADSAPVQRRIQAWFDKHQDEFCASGGLSATCLDDPMGTTATEWALEETVNRSSRTKIGTWLAARMVAEATPLAGNFCADASAPSVGIIGSGSVRLNYSLDAGYALQRRDLEEMLPFSMGISKLCISGATLKKQLEKGLNRPGEGAWPHYSGLTLEMLAGKASQIFSMKDANGTIITDDMKVLVYINSYLASQGDDYDWGICSDVSGRRACSAKITAGGEAGIAEIVKRSVKDTDAIDLKKVILDDFAKAGSNAVGPGA
ncbi:MAG: hypothetical protein COB37_09060 [Kordiimonadales bacterium]|nr:MAG: hypothetical protein COB37_09060 [Kordiimonadales bacterium]